MLENIAKQVIGSNRSIIKEFGRTKFIRDASCFVDDSGYTLHEEYVAVPHGCNPADFLLLQYHDDQRLPLDFAAQYFRDWEPVPWRNVRVYCIPSTVPDVVSTQAGSTNIQRLHPHARVPHATSPEVQTMKVKYSKHEARLLADIKKHLGSDSFPDGALFRGLSQFELEESLRFFTPVSSSIAEFGPGIYTSPDPRVALTNAGRNGAVMVFGPVDERQLNRWTPDDEEWEELVAVSMRTHYPAGPMPQAYYDADVIVGASSNNIPVSLRHLSRPIPSRDQQHVFTSYAGCQKLREALRAVVYLDGCGMRAKRGRVSYVLLGMT